MTNNPPSPSGAAGPGGSTCQGLPLAGGWARARGTVTSSTLRVDYANQGFAQPTPSPRAPPHGPPRTSSRPRETSTFMAWVTSARAWPRWPESGLLLAMGRPCARSRSGGWRAPARKRQARHLTPLARSGPLVFPSLCPGFSFAPLCLSPTLRFCQCWCSFFCLSPPCSLFALCSLAPIAYVRTLLCFGARTQGPMSYARTLLCFGARTFFLVWRTHSNSYFLRMHFAMLWGTHTRS